MKKKILIPIIVGIVVVLILLFIFLIYPKFIKKERATNNGEQENIGNEVQKPENNENNDNKDNSENNENAEKNNEQDIPKLEVYSKYPDMEWAQISVSLLDEKDIVKVVNGKLQCNPIYKGLCDIANTIEEPITKVSAYYNSYQLDASILTQSGKVYEMRAESSYEALASKDKWTMNRVLENYNIIDMIQTGVPNHALATAYGAFNNDDYLKFGLKVMFYLTSNGDLINNNGETYESLNKDFVHNICYGTASYAVSHNYQLCLYFSKDNSISYREEISVFDETKGYYVFPPKKANYTKFKNKDNNDLIVKHLYDVISSNNGQSDRNVTLVVDETSDLYEIVHGKDKGKASLQYVGKIVSASRDNYDVSFILEDGNKYTFVDNVWNYFDVPSHKAISMDNIGNLYN